MATGQGQTVVYLRKTGFGSWCIYAPKGHAMRESFHAGSKEEAVRIANNWVSSFNGWVVKVDDEL